MVLEVVRVLSENIREEVVIDFLEEGLIENPDEKLREAIYRVENDLLQKGDSE